MKKTALNEAMKAKVVVAVAAYPQRKGEPPPPAQPVYIVGVGAKRRTTAPGGWGSVTRDDGVRVRPADRGTVLLHGAKPATKWDWRGVAEDTELKTTHRIVGPTQILSTWDEYTEAIAAAQEQAREVNRVQEDAEAEAAKLNDLIGEGVASAEYQIGLGSRPGRYTGRIVIDQEASRRLRKKAER